MKKSVMSTILAAAMAIGAMPGTVFAGEAAKPYEGVTLSMWIGNSEYNDGTKAVLEKATEELGMEFNIEISPGGTDGDNIIKTRCASGDLADISNYNSGSLLTALNPKEHFLDLTDEAFSEKFDDTFKSCVMQEDRIYGAPFTTTQAGAVVYWKPDYEELGLKVPETWDEFIANCQALKDAGKADCFHAVQTMKNSCLRRILQNFPRKNTGTLLTADSIFVTRNGSSIIAFTLPGTGIKGFHILANHSDFPDQVKSGNDRGKYLCQTERGRIRRNAVCSLDGPSPLHFRPGHCKRKWTLHFSLASGINDPAIHHNLFVPHTFLINKIFQSCVSVAVLHFFDGPF